MRILILGSGAREHALAWKLSQSARCDRIYVAPGNAGTAALAENVDLSPIDLPAIAAFCRAEQIDCVVPGSEDSLVAGIVDAMADTPGLNRVQVIGPSKAAAQLEGSKAFAKAFMQRHGIPTASYRVFQQAELEAAKAYVASHPLPIVLKADGLAAGKGVLICEQAEQAVAALEEIFIHERFGRAGKQVVIEQYLRGIELSVFIFTDGEHYVLLPEAKDYKRIGEGDTGLNTGGMGAVSPVPVADKAFMKKVEQRIIQPTLQGMREEGMPYRGFLFFGLMQVGADPYVIEYNCRLGDPETEAILPRLQTDLTDMFLQFQTGSLARLSMTISPLHAFTVVLASAGYPGPYCKGVPIRLPNSWPANSLVFHAGTRWENGRLVTAGGRVISITSLGNQLSEAREFSLQLANQIDFEGKYFRKDIGWEFLPTKTE